MRPIIFVGFALALAFTPATRASNVTDAERDLEAMQGIAEAFCNAMNICDKKEYGKFTVYRYYAEETEKLLSPIELKILADCTEKFQVNLLLRQLASKTPAGEGSSQQMKMYSPQRPRSVLRSAGSGCCHHCYC